MLQEIGILKHLVKFMAKFMWMAAFGISETIPCLAGCKIFLFWKIDWKSVFKVLILSTKMQFLTDLAMMNTQPTWWWTGITNQQAEMINSTYKSNDDVYSRVDTIKSDSNWNTPFSKEIHRIMIWYWLFKTFTWQTQQFLCSSNSQLKGSETKKRNKKQRNRHNSYHDLVS